MCNVDIAADNVPTLHLSLLFACSLRNQTEHRESIKAIGLDFQIKQTRTLTHTQPDRKKIYTQKFIAMHQMVIYLFLFVRRYFAQNGFPLFLTERERKKNLFLFGILWQMKATKLQRLVWFSRRCAHNCAQTEAINQQNENNNNRHTSFIYLPKTYL